MLGESPVCHANLHACAQPTVAKEATEVGATRVLPHVVHDRTFGPSVIMLARGDGDDYPQQHTTRRSLLASTSYGQCRAVYGCAYRSTVRVRLTRFDIDG